MSWLVEGTSPDGFDFRFERTFETEDEAIAFQRERAFYYTKRRPCDAPKEPVSRG